MWGHWLRLCAYPVQGIVTQMEKMGVGMGDAKQGEVEIRHRTLFLSDCHLGTNGCRADILAEFLGRNTADTIVLVGDIVDTSQPLTQNWTPAEDRVLQLLLRRAHEGVRIVYLPGNHDSFFRRHYGHYFGSVEIVEQMFHTTADGRSFLVLHGDVCDRYAGRAQWLMRLGGQIDGVVRLGNMLVNRLRASLGLGEMRIVEFILLRINRALRYGERYQDRLVALARQSGADGIICGHFHEAALHDDLGLVYANCGDWIDNCSAIVEAGDGTLRLVFARGVPVAGVTAEDIWPAGAVSPHPVAIEAQP